MSTYLYDGSFGGFLSCIFESFERKDFSVRIISEAKFAPVLFEESLTIDTNKEKAQRVMAGLEKQIGKIKARNFFLLFLSEDQMAIQYAFEVIQQIFSGQKNILENYGNEKVMYLALTLKKVGRERHRMKAFIRFEKSTDGMYFASIAPDFNVLPLIVPFFQKRYSDQAWIIFDEKRHYGMLYNKVTVSEVELTATDTQALVKKEDVIPQDMEEAKYQQLWKSYFKSTNIEARRNIKLHLQHVPKRYWRYLTEKQ